MRALRLFTVLFGIALASCNGDTVGFDITQTFPEQHIQGSPDAHAAAIAIRDQLGPAALSQEWTFEVRGQDTPAVARIDLKSIEMTIDTSMSTPNPPACWDFIDNITVTIVSTRNGSTLQPQVIATADMPGCVTVMGIQPVDGVDLLQYVNEGFRIEIDVEGIPPAIDVAFTGVAILRAGVL